MTISTVTGLAVVAAAAGVRGADGAALDVARTDRILAENEWRGHPVQRYTSSHTNKAGRNLPAVEMVMHIPYAGSLQHIWGQVTGLTNPQDYKFCVYLQSRANSYNGPKPAEDNGSFSPINPDGTYDYVNWWANNVYDPITPFVYGFVWPNNLGNCLPTMGGPAIPQGMYDQSAAWIRIARVNTFNIALDTPYLHQDGNVTVTITGMPPGETWNKYKMLLYARGAGGLTGPLGAACGAAAKIDLIQDAVNAGTATATIVNWHAANAGLLDAATGFVAALIPEPYVPAGDMCMVNAGMPVGSQTIMTQEVARAEYIPPSATPSSSPSSSASPSPSPSASGSVSASSAPSASASALPASNNGGVNGYASSGADQASIPDFAFGMLIAFVMTVGALASL